MGMDHWSAFSRLAGTLTPKGIKKMKSKLYILFSICAICTFAIPTANAAKIRVVATRSCSKGHGSLERILTAGRHANPERNQEDEIKTIYFIFNMRDLHFRDPNRECGKDKGGGDAILLQGAWIIGAHSHGWQAR